MATKPAAKKPVVKKPAAKKAAKMGRPSLYTKELVDSILVGITAGKSLYTVLEELGKPVTVTTVFDWLETHTDFAERYTRARETQADTLADQIIAIADDSTGDVVTDAEGNPRIDHENVQRSRLRVEARKWVAAKLKPKVYGDKLQLDGKVEMTAEQIDQRLALLMAKAQADGSKQD